MLQTGPRILALANQKGGVGKTTTAISLGTALAAIGERVLIIDLDPQGNASTGLGIDRKIRLRSTYDVLIGSTPLRGAILETAVPRLHIAPSTLDLSGIVPGLKPSEAFGAWRRLRQPDDGFHDPVEFKRSQRAGVHLGQESRSRKAQSLSIADSAAGSRPGRRA